MQHAAVIAETRAWVDRVVIGLNLCPFAAAVQLRRQIRYVVCDATDETALLVALQGELVRLAGCDPTVTETTLLIHPKVLADFDDYNQFLGDAEALLAGAGFEGVFQLASFHPDYRFAGTASNAVDNSTNRSPFAMLHLLREASVARAVAAFPDAATIFESNIRTLRGMGPQRLRELMAQCRRDALAGAAAGASSAA